MQDADSDERPVEWMGSSKKDLLAMPEEVQDEIGYALDFAQRGHKHPSAKPMQGFGGAGVVEIVSNHDGDAFRAVYTVRLRGAVYVLHAFQKKSKRGIATPKPDIEIIRQRLRQAELLAGANYHG